MPRAAVLDVDGTLIDSNYQHALAWYRAFRRSGIILPLWRIHRHVGMGGDQLVPAPSTCSTRANWPTAGPRKTTSIPRSQIPTSATGPLQGADPGRSDGRGHAWDIEAACSAGVETICLITGGFCEQELREAGAAGVFSSVEELRRRLDETPFGRA
jgi:phosphoglycolate phosphatase-like HAD superfamily hydrolase